MTGGIRSLLVKIDAWPPRVLLWVNLGIAGFVALAHGGALLMGRVHPSPGAPDVESVAVISLPLAGLIFGSAGLALAVAKLQRLVLGFHGIVFLAGAVIEIAWGIGLLFRGLPAGNFSWSIGLFSISVAYAAVIFSRFTVPSRLRRYEPIYFAPVLALAVAVPIDIGVVIRFALESSARMGGGTS